MILRRRFADVIGHQLDMFVEESGGLIANCEEAEEAYDRAPRDDAEERYGDYADLVETGTEALAQIRHQYAATLEEDLAEEYREAFNRSVLKRLPRFALEIEDH